MKILGISSGHDSGVAIIEDGQIICAVNEERLLRKKNFWGHPYLSVESCLKISGTRPEEVTLIALANLTKGGGIQQSFKSGTFRKKLVDMFSFTGLADKSWVKNLYLAIFKKFRSQPELIDFLEEKRIRAPITYVEHHTAHAASAYYASPFKNSDRVLVITTDSSGDGLSCTISLSGSKGELIRKHESSYFHSPSVIYSYVTHNLGFKYLQHEGKITGLAAYGDPEKTLHIFRKLIRVDKERLQFQSSLGCWGRPAAKKLKKLCQGYSREDIAAGVQRRMEEVCEELIGEAVKRYKCDKVCLAGGLYANVKLNQKILNTSGVSRIYIHPHMGDGGVAVGSALELWAKEKLKTGTVSPKKLKHIYLGPEYSGSEIESALKESSLEYYQSSGPEAETASLLAEGKIIAYFKGPMEYGPRALGNRSILYQATDKTVNEWLNKKLKRTEFMPFAPILRVEQAPKYFRNFSFESSFPAEFMTITYDVTDLCRKQAPAVVHIDNTARPQLVNKNTNPSMYRILELYEKMSGLSLLINTSFNMHEEPIVCSPQDAIKAFLESTLDVLVMDSFIVLKKVIYVA